MAAEGAVLSFSVVSVVEDVLQKHGFRSREIDLDSRRAEEAASRRNEAASWLRKMVGVVGAKDFPAEPSEEEFRVALRSGRILCNVLNKAHPGAVSKVVESPSDSALIPDGAALSAYQYFENVRNFLVAAQEVGLPTFEASDLEQGGKSARVVNCVLALKSYCEWKQTGGNGVWKFGGNVKPTTMVRTFVRKNSEPFTGSVSRSMSTNEVSLSASSSDHEHSKMSNPSLGMLVRAVLSDKKAEEVPVLVESVLSKVVEEFELRIAAQNELREKSSQAVTVSHASKSFVTSDFCDRKPREEENSKKQLISDEDVNNQQLKRQIFDRQQSDIQELKHCLHTTKANMEFMQRKSHEDFYSLRIYIHGLAHAASGYNQVLEENRKLYNQVQDLKGSIRVYCRVRPFLDAQSNYLSTVDHIGEGNITINTPSKSGKGLRSFSFNQVYGPSATQSEVFADTQPLIRSVLDGYNVCIFAYGQTGSGKTHTMSGPKELTEQNQGVNYRALRDLFLLSEQRKGTFRYDISVQMIEIYNEQVRDLLVTDGLNRKLDIRNSSQTGINVPDANLVPVSSTLAVINLMNLGQRNRAVGATALNDRSSRSHSCLTVHVQGRDLTSGNILRGCMHLVDLAGSERVDKSEVTGDRLKEAQHINKSLAALGDVIYSLAQKNPHVPYRNSKLTQLLQDSLGGQAKTLMFVHISPEQDAVGETISTLKFAERVATIELGAARVNKDTADVKELKEQISSLKAALARKEEEPEQIQCLSGIPERFRVKTTSELSPFGTNKKVGVALADQSIGRHPMGDVGNIEVQNNSSSRQKRQSFDLPELLGNSPTWPSVVSSPDQNYREDVGLSEWEDKVMVNGHGETFYPKYIHESSKVFPDQSYGMFMANKRFDVANTDDLDDLDAATTSDSSEADLLWQFNQAKLSNMVNGVGTTAKKLATKPAKIPETSKKVVPPVGPSPSRKPSTGVNNAPRLAGRQPVSGDGKRKTGSRR